MSNIDTAMGQVDSLPGQGTPAEARKAARVLAAIGRRVGAPDRQTADVIASLLAPMGPARRRGRQL